jgi:hypothetical protein
MASSDAAAERRSHEGTCKTQYSLLDGPDSMAGGDGRGNISGYRILAEPGGIVTANLETIAQTLAGRLGHQTAKAA